MPTWVCVSPRAAGIRVPQKQSLNTHSTDQNTEAQGSWQLVQASGPCLVRAAPTCHAQPSWSSGETG